MKETVQNYFQSMLMWSEALPARGRWFGAEIDSNMIGVFNIYVYCQDNLLVLSGLTSPGRNL